MEQKRELPFLFYKKFGVGMMFGYLERCCFDNWICPDQCQLVLRLHVTSSQSKIGKKVDNIDNVFKVILRLKLPVDQSNKCNTF